LISFKLLQVTAFHTAVRQKQDAKEVEKRFFDAAVTLGVVGTIEAKNLQQPLQAPFVVCPRRHLPGFNMPLPSQV
jgi:hypothetical protein